MPSPLSSASSSPDSTFGDTSSSSRTSAASSAVASPWLYDETGAFISTKPASHDAPLPVPSTTTVVTMVGMGTEGMAERNWASGDRASVRSPLIAPPINAPPSPSHSFSAAGSPRPDPTPFSEGRLHDPTLLSPQTNRRPASIYLSLDGSHPSSPAAHGGAWPFKHPPAGGSHGIDTPLLKSPSQLNPVFAVPTPSELAARKGVAESYQDPQPHRGYGGTGYKSSPPVGYDAESATFPSSPHVDTRSHHHEPRPFYRTPNGSISQAYPRHDSPSRLAHHRRRLSSDEEDVLEPLPLHRSVLRQALDSSTAWLVYYFAFNLGLTIYNKRVLLGFPFPWTLTGVHTLCGAIGSQTALNYRFFSPGRLSGREGAVLVAFSVLYTVNIAISNVSLHLVTVPFHQVVRATTPLFTIALTTVFYTRSYSRRTYLSLLVVVLGVGFSTFGDYGWTSWGLFLTLLGTLLAASKTVVTNALLVGRLSLHPLDLLMRMSPLAFVQCVLVSFWTGEMARVREYGATRMTMGKATALAVNGIIAFGLNVVSFTANKKTSALTMTVAANVKQVLTIVLAVFVFELDITPLNLFGISLTLLGGAWYARIELETKRRDAGKKHGLAGRGVEAEGFDGRDARDGWEPVALKGGVKGSPLPPPMGIGEEQKFG